MPDTSQNNRLEKREALDLALFHKLTSGDPESFVSQFFVLLAHVMKHSSNGSQPPQLGELAAHLVGEDPKEVENPIGEATGRVYALGCIAIAENLRVAHKAAAVDPLIARLKSATAARFRRQYKRIRIAMAKENVSPVEGGLRLGITGGGCSGLSYNIRFDSQPRERDRIYQFDDIRLFVDPKSFIYLHGMILDYEETLMRQGFNFINPNSTKSCGCGSSFSA